MAKAISPAEECALNMIYLCPFPLEKGFLHYSFDTIIQIIGGETIMPSEKVLEAKKAKVEQLTETLKNAVSFVTLTTRASQLKRIQSSDVISVLKTLSIL